MVRYTASEVNLEEFAASRKAAKEKERSGSPSSSRSGSPGAKRKIRKTTGEGGEALDELELIGYQVRIRSFLCLAFCMKLILYVTLYL